MREDGKPSLAQTVLTILIAVVVGYFGIFAVLIIDAELLPHIGIVHRIPHRGLRALEAIYSPLRPLKSLLRRLR